MMYRNDFCIINENIPRRHRRTNSQFLKHVMIEEEKSRAIGAQEIQMTSENPMIKEQKQSHQICSELQLVEREKFLDEKRKRLLHQNEDQIRELDVQIKRSYVQRQLVEQKAQKEQQIKEELQARMEENRRFAEQFKRNLEITRQEEIENQRKKEAFRQELRNQMQEREELRELKKKEIEKERKSREKYLEDIQRDIEKEKQLALEYKEILRKDRDEYLHSVAVHKRQKKLESIEDRRKYLEFARQREEEKRLRFERRKQALRQREAFSEQMGQRVLTMRMEKQNYDDFLQQLLIEERLAKDEKRHQNNIERQIQRARSLNNEFQTLFMERQQDLLYKRGKNTLTTQEQLKASQKLEEEEKEKEKLRKLKEKQRQELLNSIEFRKWERQIEASEDKARYEQQIASEKKRQEDIEAEKLYLLRSVPLENLKFLPFKAISEEHRSMLGLTCKETKEKIV